MAFNCATDATHIWTSTLRSDAVGSQDVPDGQIEIDTEDATTGDFFGTHINTGGLIKGKCRAGSGGTCTDAAPCHIEFDRRGVEGNQIFHFHYEADFKVAGNNFVTINGRYTKRLVRGGRRPLDDDDGTWVGTKPVT